MGMLQRFESRLEQAVSGAFAKAFRSAVQPVELAAALQREIDNSAQILSRNRRLVPNTFGVELSAVDYERLQPYSESLHAELTDLLREHADEQHYVFAGPVSIDFAKADALRPAPIEEARYRLRKVGGRDSVVETVPQFKDGRRAGRGVGGLHGHRPVAIGEARAGGKRRWPSGPTVTGTAPTG